MSNKRTQLGKIAGLATTAILFSLAWSAAFATHSWGPPYHWARTADNFALQVIDSVTSDWDAQLLEALQTWNDSVVLDSRITKYDDSTRTRRRCQAVTGQMRVCNGAYGLNEWAGLASINIEDVDGHSHIIKATVKMNDTYGPYAREFMNHVMCQEIGHVFGLGHTSEDGSSQSTCMDYSNDLNSQWPNDHDFGQLLSIYEHYDSYESYAGATGGGNDAPKPCRGRKCSTGFETPEVPPMGVRVHHNAHSEIWVARGRGDSLWIHHVTLVPEEYR